MNVETARIHESEHELTVSRRSALQVSGVTDVVSFDEETVLLNTTCGTMEVQGSALHIHVLSIDRGLVSLDGKINAITYFEQETPKGEGKGGFFSKIFR